MKLDLGIDGVVVDKAQFLKLARECYGADMQPDDGDDEFISYGGAEFTTKENGTHLFIYADQSCQGITIEGALSELLVAWVEAACKLTGRPIGFDRPDPAFGDKPFVSIEEFIRTARHLLAQASLSRVS